MYRNAIDISPSDLRASIPQIALCTLFLCVLLPPTLVQAVDGGSTGWCTDYQGRNFPCRDTSLPPPSRQERFDTLQYTAPSPPQPDSRAVRRSRMIEINQRGVELLDAGKWEEAAATFREALAEVENASDADIVRGNLASVETRRRHDAMNTANRRGIALSQKGDYVSAAAAYREGLGYADIEDDRRVLEANLRDAEAWLRAREEHAWAERARQSGLQRERETVRRIIDETLQSDRDALNSPRTSDRAVLDFRQPGKPPSQGAAKPAPSGESLFSKGSKDSAPVPLEFKDPAAKLPVVDPRTVKGERLATPQEADRANAAALLAALSASQGDFVRADAYLKDLQALHPNDPVALAIGRYIQSLRKLKAAAAPSDPRFQPRQDDAQALLESVAHPDRQPPTTRWPGPAKATPIVNAKVTALLDAMDYGKGDWDKGLAYLDRLVGAHPRDKAIADARKTFADLMAHERGR